MADDEVKNFWVDKTVDPPQLKMREGLEVTPESAIHFSIEKWQTIFDHLENGGGTVDDGGQYTCALCIAFRIPICHNCPVKAATGAAYCENSPYEDWCVAEEKGDAWGMRQAASEELAFLENIRDGQNDQANQ